MSVTMISAPAKSHLIPVLRALVGAGWALSHAPDRGKLVRNSQKLVLRSGESDIRLRLFVYKVTGSGRQKPDERRIEITSTYQKGLRRLRGYPDVVLGYDATHDIFVGVDPKRIAHGGPTGNASSFFDREGLGWNREDEILIRPRKAKLFPGGLEFHAFIRPLRLAEYFFNLEAIHSGAYGGDGKYSGMSSTAVSTKLRIPAESAAGDLLILDGPRPSHAKRQVSKRVVQAIEKGDIRSLSKRRLTPEQFLRAKRRMEENGRLGEEFVLNYERKALRRAKKRCVRGTIFCLSSQRARRSG